MRGMIFVILCGLSLNGLSACTTPVQGRAVASVNAHCDEYEGYPDCYPNHVLE
ncbi:MAG: hypothetical protein JWM91_1554 [Rhodospirillales bacterium]|nr:hypothetical protein [Rhodospirillales bacterium]